MKGAYTLIELLVAISIFSLVVAGFTDFFISALRVQRKTLAFREIVDSASYVLDYMARSLRMAKKDDIEIRGVQKNCLAGNKINYEVLSGQSAIKFRNYNNQCQRFFLDGGRIKEEREGESYFLTSSNLDVINLKFFLSGDSPGDNLQPRVTILIEIQKRGQPETKTLVQTTISQRDLDF